MYACPQRLCACTYRTVPSLSCEQLLVACCSPPFISWQVTALLGLFYQGTHAPLGAGLNSCPARSHYFECDGDVNKRMRSGTERQIETMQLAPSLMCSLGNCTCTPVIVVPMSSVLVAAPSATLTIISRLLKLHIMYFLFVEVVCLYLPCCTFSVVQANLVDVWAHTARPLSSAG